MVRRAALAGNSSDQSDTPSSRRAAVAGKSAQVSQHLPLRRATLAGKSIRQSNTPSSRDAALKAKSTQQVSTPPLRRSSFEGESTRQRSMQSSRGAAVEVKSTQASQHADGATCCTCRQVHPNRASRLHHEAPQLKSSQPKQSARRPCNELHFKACQYKQSGKPSSRGAALEIKSTQVRQSPPRAALEDMSVETEPHAVITGALHSGSSAADHLG